MVSFNRMEDLNFTFLNSTCWELNEAEKFYFEFEFENETFHPCGKVPDWDWVNVSQFLNFNKLKCANDKHNSSLVGRYLLFKIAID